MEILIAGISMKCPINQDCHNGQAKNSCYNENNRKHNDITSHSGGILMIQPITGHILEIGDRVKINIEAVKNGDMDGVEFSSSGKKLLALYLRTPQ